jgi:hypothetical protein
LENIDKINECDKIINQEAVKMGISIYYDAKRNYFLTDEGSNNIKEIVEKYNNEKDKKFKKGEDFYIYEYDKEEPEKIFSGSTKLAMSSRNPMIVAKCCIFLAKCLTKIRSIVKDAEWSVSMDDTDLEWDERNGWHLPGLKWDNKNGWILPGIL